MLSYRPGLLVGGTLEHDCSLQRSIGYFLEPLILLAPFAKTPLKITLRGNTNSSDDLSVSCVLVSHLHTFLCVLHFSLGDLKYTCIYIVAVIVATNISDFSEKQIKYAQNRMKYHLIILLNLLSSNAVMLSES